MLHEITNGMSAMLECKPLVKLEVGNDDSEPVEISKQKTVGNNDSAEVNDEVLSKNEDSTLK